MKLPPLHTALFRAENLLSPGGMIVPKYCFTRSGYSRRAVSMSQKRIPGFALPPRHVVDHGGVQALFRLEHVLNVVGPAELVSAQVEVGDGHKRTLPVRRICTTSIVTIPEARTSRRVTPLR